MVYGVCVQTVGRPRGPFRTPCLYFSTKQSVRLKVLHPTRSASVKLGEERKETEKMGTQRPRCALATLPKSHLFTRKLPPDPLVCTPLQAHRAAATKRSGLGPRMVRDALYTFVPPVPVEEPELLAVSENAMNDIGLDIGEKETQDFRDLVAGNKILWSEDPEDQNRQGQGIGEKETEGNEVLGSKDREDQNWQGQGIYPWAQCYGGWQFGQWAGQLGDGRAISLFESTNPSTGIRYEIQLKGAGRTPYSRFADGRAVLRSSIREFVVSEALNAMGIPSTRALALTLAPKERVQRETFEPGAIVTRFAQSWLRIGTFDILRARGDRKLIRQLATYLAEDVFGGWETLPAPLSRNESTSKENQNATPQDHGGKVNGNDDHDDAVIVDPPRNIPASAVQDEENRFTRLYREIVRRNASTVAAWQCYGFMNGVLNTDNTSLFGLSLDFGPFAFMDNFDPDYTPNHDDHMLRYSYRNQPSVIWWNLVRLGESLGELMGAGERIDEAIFVEHGVQREDKAFMEELVDRAQRIIQRVGQEYQAVFHAEYRRLLAARLGLKHYHRQHLTTNATSDDSHSADTQTLVSSLLDLLEKYELDFNHFFRRLSSLPLSALDPSTRTEEQRRQTARIFFHKEGISVVGETDDSAAAATVVWLDKWRQKVVEDWSERVPNDGEDNTTTRETTTTGAPSNSDHRDGEEDPSWDISRRNAMLRVNPCFIPRSWVLDEVIKRVQQRGDREVLDSVLEMALNPFDEYSRDRDDDDSDSNVEKKTEEERKRKERRADQKRFCADVPREGRGMMCSCSS